LCLRAPSVLFLQIQRVRVRRTSRPIIHSLSIPCPLAFIGAFSCYFLLSNISPSSYSRRRAARSTENPYYMYAHLYLAYSARNFGPARLATLVVLHIFWTSCRCSGSLFPPSYCLCVVDSLALRIYFPRTLARRAAFTGSFTSSASVIYLLNKAIRV
jgi:hypothetical protein